MKNKLTGSTSAALVVFLISGLSASVLGVRQMDRINNHEVWAISGSWPVDTQISIDKLRKIYVDKEQPGLKDPKQVLGKRLANAKKDGELVLPQDIKRPQRSWLAQQVPEDKVLYTLSPNPGSIPFSQLRNGDLFDVLVTNRNGVKTVAKNVLLIGALTGNNAEPQKSAQPKGLAATLSARKRNIPSPSPSLVVAVTPEEVYALAHITAKDTVSIVLHGEQSNPTERNIAIMAKPTHRQVEVISGKNRRVISVDI